MHAHFADLNPGSLDSLLREVAGKRFELAYETAIKLSISQIVFHIGYVPGTGIPKNWAGRCVNFWNEFLEGKSEKMNYYIKNTNDHHGEKDVHLGFGQRIFFSLSYLIY